MKRKVICVLVNIVLIVSGFSCATAFAGPGGGTWHYGVDVTVWSDYHHPSKKHSATACNDGDCSKVFVNKNLWAKAWKITNPWANHNVYWAIEK